MNAPLTEARTEETIRPEEITPYLNKDADFIDDEKIHDLLTAHRHPDRARLRDVFEKSLALQRLEPPETAALLNMQDDDLWQEAFATAAEVKNRVYGPRIVTFAPLYCSNLCTNGCVYCGFRAPNRKITRRTLSLEEVRRETEALVSTGHKRLIAVYGEHPASGVRYMLETIRAIYETKVGNGEIRRVNVNAAPQCISNYRLLKDVGIGTLQVFQETYHHDTYRKVHPRGPKSHYAWRLYALHRAQEAGIDDVAIGALFGLYDWRFEVLGLLHHTIDLEKRFSGVGPHTISFPRIEPALNTPFNLANPHAVSDRDFKRLVTVLRLSVPYTGMVITAREPASIRQEVIRLGCTQTDASSRIGIGAYAEEYSDQDVERQQFMLGDVRDLDELVMELAEADVLTSFCTADYRCGRTGAKFMDMAKGGKVHHLCVPNAVLTLKEYLLDHASEETRRTCQQLIERHVAASPSALREELTARLKRIEEGERDLYF